MIKNQLEKIIIAVIKQNPVSAEDLFVIVRQEAGKFKLPPPNKSQLLSAYHGLLKNKKLRVDKTLEQMLTKRAVRTMSGVAVISVLTKPSPCTGNCLYCPTESDMPKSYLSNEPAVMRAILCDFDPYRQIKMRLQALEANGHQTDKIELIIMGGTWSCHPQKYQNWFIRRCYEALNGRLSKSLAIAQKTNETARHRCIGLTLETRPDYIDTAEIIQMRKFGCTRVELGIQHIDDKILQLNRRGHTSRQSTSAIHLLRSVGLKINYHLMLNLPGSTPAKDLTMFKKLYTHPDWMPDMIKIYPCVVNEHSDLYQWWKKDKYKPYTKRQLMDLIIKIKKITPPYVRITRLIRDIPKESIVAGNKITNLRQIIGDLAGKQGWNCQCIRCREVGRQKKNFNFQFSNLKLKKIKYSASGGGEYFLSFESEDGKVLYAFLRLRINSFPCLEERPRRGLEKQGDSHASLGIGSLAIPSIKNIFPELKDAAIIRELHTYGLSTAIGKSGDVQHLGLGKKLLAEAEKITRQTGLTKIAVISGIGAREYYRKNGYELDGTYMIKTYNV